MGHRPVGGLVVHRPVDAGSHAQDRGGRDEETDYTTDDVCRPRTDLGSEDSADGKGADRRGSREATDERDDLAAIAIGDLTQEKREDQRVDAAQRDRSRRPPRHTPRGWEPAPARAGAAARS